MKFLCRYILLVCVFFISDALFSQTAEWQDVYKVKKKDTLYGITKKYNITIDDLVNANPGLNDNGIYKLQKGDILYIPYSAKTVAKAREKSLVQDSDNAAATHKNSVNVGIMLPLHNNDGDGRRMIEYYRGFLMACDSLKAKGVDVNIYAWNVPSSADIRITLLDENAAKCDIIFGPLYSSQVKALGDFCQRSGIKLVVPFSITGSGVESNSYIFQIYRTSTDLNTATVAAFIERFSDCHPVFIDCNDSTSRKGTFTAELRKQLEAKGIAYNITSLKSAEENFAKAFNQTQPNVVILNTARSPELNVALAKIDGLNVMLPDIKISLFGYTEWLMYTKSYSNYFHKYDTYIPTTFYYNAVSNATLQFEASYKKWFKSEIMKNALPHFALTGYDHALFFISGMHKYGKDFTGQNAVAPYFILQTKLKFKRVSDEGGMQNVGFMLVHYKENREIESINY